MAYYKCGTIHPTQNSNVVVDTASGTIANFETPLAMPLLDAQIDVNAVQDLHGQSGAYPAGGSAQIWDEQWEVGYYSMDGRKVGSNGIRSKNPIPVTPNTTYYFNAPYNCRNALMFYDANGDFLSYKWVVHNNSFTTPDGCYSIAFDQSADYGNVYKNNISINYPATDTAYHPYSNICPIDGWDEINVGYVDFNQLSLPADTGRAWQGITPSFDNGVYTLSGEATNTYSNITQTITPVVDNIYLIGKVVVENPNNISFNWSFLNASKSPYTPGSSDTQWSVVKVVTQNGTSTGISGFDAGTDFTGVKFKVVCINLTQALGKEKANYIFSLPNYGVDIARQIFTKDYYPYNEGGTLVSLNDVNGKSVCPVDTIQLGNTYYGGRFIQDKNGKRKFEVTHERRPFSMGMADGLWSQATWGGGGTVYSRTLPCKSNELTTLTGAMSEIYKEVTPSSMFGRTEPAFCINGTLIRVRDNRFSTFDEWKEAVKDYYYTFVIETPIIIDLPDGTPFKSLPGVNTVFADTGDTAVKFRKIGE